MIDYQLYCQIRQMRDQEKTRVGQIARALGIERKTVRKWMGRPKFERRQSAENHAGASSMRLRGRSCGFCTPIRTRGHSCWCVYATRAMSAATPC